MIRHPTGLIIVHDGHELGELLRGRRQRLNRTLADVGTRTNMHLTQVSEYEIGKASPTAVTLVRLLPGYSWGMALIPREDTRP